VPHRGEHLRGEVGDGDVDAGDPEVDGQDAAGPAVELQDRGRATAGAPAPAALLEQVRLDQLSTRALIVLRDAPVSATSSTRLRARPFRTWRSSAPGEAEVCATPS
jgi:hypothetical protein